VVADRSARGDLLDAGNEEAVVDVQRVPNGRSASFGSLGPFGCRSRTWRHLVMQSSQICADAPATRRSTCSASRAQNETASGGRHRRPIRAKAEPGRKSIMSRLLIHDSLDQSITAAG